MMTYGRTDKLTKLRLYSSPSGSIKQQNLPDIYRFHNLGIVTIEENTRQLSHTLVQTCVQSLVKIYPTMHGELSLQDSKSSKLSGAATLKIFAGQLSTFIQIFTFVY